MDAVVGRRVLLSGGVPGPRGIVAGQSGVVSSFFVGVTNVGYCEVACVGVQRSPGRGR